MAYEKQEWRDNSPATPIDAARLGHIEDGIEATAVVADKAAAAIADHLDDPSSGLRIEDVSFIFTQGTPSAVWEIEHPLSFRPSVTIVDSAGTEILTEITHISPTLVLSTSAGAFSGSAYLS